ncbi:MAG: hypothetical protein HY812_17865 [Planctomycetes bacterium]|nr:hypothetical protein [Planctomycetota bacterium]
MEYAITRSSGQCQRCAHPFAGGERFYSVIRLEDAAPARTDYCVPCFEKSERDPERDFAFWKTRKAEGQRARPAVDFKALRDLFFRMAERCTSEYQKLTYLLGLVLIRKRVVRLEKFVSEGGADYLVATTRERPEPLKIVAPELGREEIEELRGKLRALLEIDYEDERTLAGEGALPSASGAEPAPGA